MRLNPFARSSPGRLGGHYTDDEDIVAIRPFKHNRNKRHSLPARRPKKQMMESDDDERYRGRPRSRSRSQRGPPPRGGRSMTPDARKRLNSQRADSPGSSPEEDIVRQESSQRGGRRGPPRRSSSRNLSSSPERGERRPPPRRNSAGASRASSRRSRASAYSSASEMDEPRRVRRSSSRGSEQRGRPRRRSFPESDDDEEQDGISRLSSRSSRVVPGSSRRRSRSRGDSDDEDDEMLSRARSQRSRKSGGSHHSRRRRPQSVSRRSSRSGAPPPTPRRKSSKKNKTKATPKQQSQRNSWGFPFGSRRNKSKREMRDDDEEEDVVDVESDESEYDLGEKTRKREKASRRSSIMSEDSDIRDPPSESEAPTSLYTPRVQAPPPAALIAKMDEEQYVAPPRTPKRQSYANLYEYDNFPAIDRVPTAIGYRSDDSKDEFVDEGDDNGSFTSRYTVDVKSVRARKLKKKGQSGNTRNRYMNTDKEEDNFSHDENDDKYAQYNAGAQLNAVMSDSSDSCPPTWHPALDVDDSDWYDEDEETAKNLKREKTQNKKYQVSGIGKAGKKNKKKVPVTSDDEDRPKAAKVDKEDSVGHRSKKQQQEEEEEDEPEEVEEPKDAIVANRSELSDMVHPHSSRARVPRSDSELLENVEEEDSEDEGRRRRPKSRGGGKNRRGSGPVDLDDEISILEEDETSLNEDRKSRKNKHGGGNTETGRRNNMKAFAKGGMNKAKSLKSKFQSFRRGNRGGISLATSSGDSYDDVTNSVRIAPTPSLYSEDHDDPALAELEMEEFKESTATHNRTRNNRKELLELDEMDEASVQANPNAFACGVLPLLGLGGGTSDCFFGSSTAAADEGIQLDSIQMQRLKDAKAELENKPKVEVILQDLQDPMAEKYEQLEKAQRKQQREAHREKHYQQEIEKQEREDHQRRKREMREAEQKKIHMAQNRDQLALEEDLHEAPDFSRGKSSSFVMDISNWVLNLDNNEPTTPTPTKKKGAREHQTPRTNGRDGSSSPIESLPFSEIEVPTTVDNSLSGDSDHLAPPKKTQQRWRRKKKRGISNAQSSGSSLNENWTPPPAGTKALRQQDGKAIPNKKKGWFRRSS